MQSLFAGLQKHPAMAVHDRLGIAGGARGIDHPERMIEGHLHERERRVLPDQVRPGHGPLRHRLGHRHAHLVLQRRQAGDDLGQCVRPVDGPAGMDISVLGDQQLRFDLPEPVEDGDLAHVGRAERPDRAEAERREAGDQRGFGIGQDRHHPVALPHPHLPHLRRDAGHLRAQLGPGHLAAPEGFRLHDQRHPVRGDLALAQDLLGKVQPRPWKPHRAGHLPLGECHFGNRGDAQVEEGQDRGPEPVQIAYAPLPERVVIVKGQTTLAVQPAQEIGHPAGRGTLGRRGPEDRPGGHPISAAWTSALSSERAG